MRALLVSLVLFSCQVFAQEANDAKPVETSKAFGDYVVYYNAFPSTTLLPAIAADYKIERGNDIAFINIAVRNKAGGGDMAQAVTIKGTFSDLIHSQPLKFREIREQNAIYYIAQARYGNRDVLRFDVQVEPVLKEGESVPINSPFKISFTRQFYTEK